MLETIEPLLSYTDWQRREWREFFQTNRSAWLAPTGTNASEKLATIASVVRHIFTAELRYVERLRGEPVTDPESIAMEDVGALFAFGERSRAAVRSHLTSPKAIDWDTPVEMSILGKRVSMSPRKTLIHAVTHEIRHWAQIATMLRFAGHRGPPLDFLFSPVCGDPVRF